MRYRQSAVLEREIVFQGIRYDIGLPVDAALTWNAWRFGYELDVMVRDRGFLAIILEAKYTDVQAEIDSAVGFEYARARAPIPAVGAIGRVYVTRFTPIAAEFTAFKMPDDLVKNYSAPACRLRYLWDSEPHELGGDQYRVSIDGYELPFSKVTSGTSRSEGCTSLVRSGSSSEPRQPAVSLT